MKPPPFEYAAPETIEEISALLAEYGDEARIIAGGQSLMPLLALRVVRPTVLIDIGRVSALDGWRQENGILRVGANLRQQDLLEDEDLKSALPLCAEAAPQIGHPATRSRGTIIGSICHADPAAELPVCALALGALMTVRSADGERQIAAADFFDGALSTAVSDEEFVPEVHIPLPDVLTGFAFCELSRRHGDFALVGVGCSASLDTDKRIVTARVGIGGVDDTPLCFDLDSAAKEQISDGQSVGDVAESIASQLDPGTDLHATSDYRRAMAALLIDRALQTAVSRASEG